MVRVTSSTPIGPRNFVAIVCRAGELSERGRTVATLDMATGEPRYRPRGDVVEIFDETYRGKPGFHPNFGQFVADYSLQDVAGRGDWAWNINGPGVDLLGSEPTWKLDAGAMREIMLFAANVSEVPE